MTEKYTYITEDEWKQIVSDAHDRGMVLMHSHRVTEDDGSETKTLIFEPSWPSTPIDKGGPRKVALEVKIIASTATLAELTEYIQIDNRLGGR